MAETDREWTPDPTRVTVVEEAQQARRLEVMLEHEGRGTALGVLAEAFYVQLSRARDASDRPLFSHEELVRMVLAVLGT